MAGSRKGTFKKGLSGLDARVARKKEKRKLLEVRLAKVRAGGGQRRDSKGRFA